jgi:hypothetical protein
MFYLPRFLVGDVDRNVRHHAFLDLVSSDQFVTLSNRLLVG